ncbi:MAG: hypothetical protein ABSD38_29230 [Syntrophorhabdales bacterium]
MSGNGAGPLIHGGYYLKARCIQNAEIAGAPPHVREIWDWLLKEANHADAKVADMIITRGQCVRSYKDIQEGLAWHIGWRKRTYSKDDCETAMKWLTKRAMVTTKKTTRGMVITICKYDFYQNPANYENHSEADNETTRKPQTRHTINKKDKKEKDFLSPEGSGNGHCPHQDIIQLYHKTLPMLTHVRDWHEGRQEQLRARWTEDPERQDLEWWQSFFDYVKSCPHLIGENDRGWKPNLEWLVERKNFVKIIEGNYEARKQKMVRR